jgi:hypothetical protein
VNNPIWAVTQFSVRVRVTVYPISSVPMTRYPFRIPYVRDGVSIQELGGQGQGNKYTAIHRDIEVKPSAAQSLPDPCVLPNQGAMATTDLDKP